MASRGLTTTTATGPIRRISHGRTETTHVGIIGSQFGHPSGVLGGLAGKFMARNNAGFNRWVAAEATSQLRPDTILEIGSGPGVGTRELTDSAPQATITALDPSPAMHRQLRRRNRRAIEAGQVRTISGDLDAVADMRDVDLAVAVHVLYFWKEPEEELWKTRRLLRPRGVLALGYQLRGQMPAMAQRDFPTSGHRLYEHDEEVLRMAWAAGFDPQPVRIFGSDADPGGRLLLATRAD